VVEISDSMLAVGLGAITLLIGFVYFTITRKDRRGVDNASSARDEEQGELDKQELARKVKKELQDEAEKVETIRKAVAVDVREENKEYVDRRIIENISSVEHKFDMYEQKIESRFSLSEERNASKFTAMDSVMNTLMTKMVETANTQANALVKINESIDYLRRLLNEMSNKVQRVEKEQDKRGD
jgi:hypothetical protein